TAGGRRVFHYYADTVEHKLYLQDKVPTDSSSGAFPENWISDAAWANIGDERTKIHPRGINTRRNRGFAKGPKPVDRHKMILNYQTADGNEVILTGIDQNRDSLYIVLNRADRDYLLSRSTLDAGQYD